MKLTERIASVLHDPRDPDLITHPLVDLLRPRLYGIVQGYEDRNDHERLREDARLQTVLDREDALGSAPMLCRMENRASRTEMWALHREMVETFLASFDQLPEELVLDFDATDDPLPGKQEESFFHGHYDCYCYLPLYVFCGEQLLVACLRPSKIDGAKHAWAILALLGQRLHQAWPTVRIVLRADSGFCRHRMLAGASARASATSWVWRRMRACGHRIRQTAGHHAARQVLKDWGRDPPQHAQRARAAELCLPLSGELSARRPDAALPIAARQCCPRHADKQRG